jgi:ATP-dependent Clp protease ATP-binding subunit ClpB
VAAAVLSNRYITDRFLPDKAIDLVDEAGAKLRTEIDSMPDRTRRSLAPHDAARDRARSAAQRNRRSSEGPPRQDRARAGRAARRNRRLKARWQGEKDAVRNCARCASRSTRPRPRSIAPQRQTTRTAPPSSSTARWPNSRSSSRTKRRRSGDGAPRLLKEEVDEEDIADVVSRWTGVPVSKLLEGEMQKLLKLDEELHKRVIGQDEAVTAVAEADRARARVSPIRTAARLVHLPRARPAWARRNWRARSRASLRRRTRDDPHRHVGVSGEAHVSRGCSAHRRDTSATTKAVS